MVVLVAAGIRCPWWSELMMGSVLDGKISFDWSFMDGYDRQLMSVYSFVCFIKCDVKSDV